MVNFGLMCFSCIIIARCQVSFHKFMVGVALPFVVEVSKPYATHGHCRLEPQPSRRVIPGIARHLSSINPRSGRCSLALHHLSNHQSAIIILPKSCRHVREGAPSSTYRWTTCSALRETTCRFEGVLCSCSCRYLVLWHARMY